MSSSKMGDFDLFVKVTDADNHDNHGNKFVCHHDISTQFVLLPDTQGQAQRWVTLTYLSRSQSMPIMEKSFHCHRPPSPTVPRQLWLLCQHGPTD